MEFKFGQRVKVRGDIADCTEHLDGCIGTIIIPEKKECKVRFTQSENKDHRIVVTDWWIWNHNITPLDDANG